MSIDFDRIASAALAQARTLLPEIFPEGKFSGPEFKIGSVAGEPGDSLQFNIVKGFGQDFATGHKFGDIIDLYAAATSRDLKDAAMDLAQRYGIVPLTNGHTNPAPLEYSRPEPKPFVCPPPDVPIGPESFTHFKFGPPSRLHMYRDLEGRLMYVVARYDADPDRGMVTKQIVPWTWAGDCWAAKAPPQPRPLYGLDSLAKFPNAKVIVVEGEKCADAARTVFQSNPVVSWPNGSQALNSADWGPMAGRDVVIWPDNDTAGHTCCTELARKLAAQNCKIWTVDVAGQPDKWDCADAIEVEGWDPAKVKGWVRDRMRDWMAAPAPAPEAPYSPPEPAPAPPRARKRPKPETPPEAPEEGGEPPAPSQVELWERYGLHRKGNGNPFASLDNAVKILTCDLPPGVLHFDPFLNRIIRTVDGIPASLTDADILAYQLMMQRRVGIQEMGKATVADAIALFAKANKRNSLQEWLRSLEWDGTSRIESLFVRGFGAENTEYHRAVSRCFLIGMVARAMRPGCQVDALPVLEGSQGAGKTRGLEALAGSEFFAEIDSPIGSKEFSEQIQGKWLVELSELASMRPTAVERVKSGITRTVDVYREPFAILSTDHPRQCVFAGTTNANLYLVDETGNRRFWPVQVSEKEIDRAWIRDNRTQLFAEALAKYESGSMWWDVPAEEHDRATKSRMFVDSLSDSVKNYCDARTGAVSIPEILDSWELPKGQWNSVIQKRIAACLRENGYRPVKRSGRQVWLPATGDQMRLANVRRI